MEGNDKQGEITLLDTPDRNLFQVLTYAYHIIYHVLHMEIHVAKLYIFVHM